MGLTATQKRKTEIEVIVTYEEYENRIQLLIVPEGDQMLENSSLPGDQTFWVHTVGMSELERPEIEMRDVPGIFVSQAGQVINHWAYYSLTKKKIKSGERMMEESGPFGVVLEATASLEDWFVSRGWDCIRLNVVGYTFSCSQKHDDVY